MQWIGKSLSCTRSQGGSDVRDRNPQLQPTYIEGYERVQLGRPVIAYCSTSAYLDHLRHLLQMLLQQMQMAQVFNLHHYVELGNIIRSCSGIKFNNIDIIT